MEKLEVGCEVEILDFVGRYKILEIQNKIIKIKFGCCKMHINRESIIKIYAKKKLFFLSNKNSKKYYDFLDFNNTIDLHGKDLFDSLELLDEWISRGLNLGNKYFKIIHGNGAGILKKNVKKFLSKKKLLKYSHESDCGGVTLIQL